MCLDTHMTRRALRRLSAITRSAWNARTSPRAAESIFLWIERGGIPGRLRRGTGDGGRARVRHDALAASPACLRRACVDVRQTLMNMNSVFPLAFSAGLDVHFNCTENT